MAVIVLRQITYKSFDNMSCVVRVLEYKCLNPLYRKMTVDSAKSGKHYLKSKINFTNIHIKLGTLKITYNCKKNQKHHQLTIFHKTVAPKLLP